MSAPLVELKTRARLRLNATRAAQPETTLRHCLNEIARELGYSHWEHARRVLGALAEPGDDMGTFWYAPQCHALLNAWFARAGDARVALSAHAGNVLLPYRRQFVVVRVDYLRTIGLDPGDADWDATGRDLVRAYGSDAWARLARRRMNAPPERFERR